LGWSAQILKPKLKGYAIKKNTTVLDSSPEAILYEETRIPCSGTTRPGFANMMSRLEEYGERRWWGLSGKRHVCRLADGEQTLLVMSLNLGYDLQIAS
jgi:hypothetical protein